MQATLVAASPTWNEDQKGRATLQKGLHWETESDRGCHAFPRRCSYCEQTAS